MKLSDAMMLGSTMFALDSAIWTRGDECPSGCLIGRGYLATHEVPVDVVPYPGYREMLEEWPCLSAMVPPPDFLVPQLSTKRAKGLDQIASWISICAREVEAGDLTLDQVVQWVQSVEDTPVPEFTPAVIDEAVCV